MKVFVTILAVAFVATLAGSASASETRLLCNSVPNTDDVPRRGKTRLTKDLWVALGFRRDGEWVSSGWWQLRPGECERLSNFSTPASQVYLSVFEHNPKTGESYTWPGNFIFCTRDQNYQGNPAERCNSGFEKTEFFKMIRGSDDKSRGSTVLHNPRVGHSLHFFKRGN